MKNFSAKLLSAASLLALVLNVAPAARATTIFSVSVGTQPANVGTVTLTQIDATTVNVFVDLLSGYGFINTGGPHTPFAFTLAGSETGVSANFVTPAGGSYGSGKTFSLNLGGGSATPYGSYGVAIDDSAGNGSANGYFGDLKFNLSRTGGLLESDFIANADGYYFAADLSNGSNTGSQAWKVKTPGTSVPDGGATVALVGAGLAGLGLIARRRKTA